MTCEPKGDSPQVRMKCMRQRANRKGSEASDNMSNEKKSQKAKELLPKKERERERDDTRKTKKKD